MGQDTLGTRPTDSERIAPSTRSTPPTATSAASDMFGLTIPPLLRYLVTLNPQTSTQSPIWTALAAGHEVCGTAGHVYLDERSQHAAPRSDRYGLGGSRYTVGRRWRTVSSRKELIGALVEEMPWYISAAVRFQAAVAHQLNMPITDLHALGALLETGPIGASRLAELMGVTTSAITRLVDRLERAGYVRREPDPTDRRRTLLHLVSERLADIAGFYEPMATRWQRHIDRYSEAELQFLLEFLRQGREDSKAETARLRTGGRAHGTRRRHTRR